MSISDWVDSVIPSATAEVRGALTAAFLESTIMTRADLLEYREDLLADANSNLNEILDKVSALAKIPRARVVKAVEALSSSPPQGAGGGVGGEAVEDRVVKVEAMCSWIGQNVPGINAATRMTYASSFYDHNAAIVERVAKKNKEWFVNTCGVDEEDAGDILRALASLASQSSGDRLAAGGGAAAARVVIERKVAEAPRRPRLELFESTWGEEYGTPPSGLGKELYDAANSNDIDALAPICMQWAGNKEVIDWCGEWDYEVQSDKHTHTHG